VRDAAKTRTIIIHATVSKGSAHQTRREVPSDAGGGGGRGTLVVAVPTLSVPMALMTVTEVTTRIAIVGVLSFAALVVLARAGGRRVEHRTTATFRSAASDDSVALLLGSTAYFRRRGPLGSRIASLALVAVASGAMLGILVSLVLTTILNTMSEGV